MVLKDKTACFTGHRKIPPGDLTQKTGGTAYTVHYAKKKMLTVYNVAKEKYL